jgi:Na+/H+ antiporter NhaD/arsenite permease-like protein
MISTLAWFALGVFLLAFVVISSGKINITIVALLGALIFIVSGVLKPDQIFTQIDWNVIFLLVSMMIIINITKTTGFFQFIAIKAAKAVRGDPLKLLILLSIITAVISMFLDNVTTVLILCPMTILIAAQLEITPVPFIICLAVASNIGGTATLIGDPPNVMIGSAAHLDFLAFLTNLGPVILVVLIVFSFLACLLFHKEMHVSNERRAHIMDFDESKSLQNKPLLVKCIVVLGLVVVGFFCHGLINMQASMVALAGATVLLLVSGSKDISEYFKDVEWETIFFFIGLFILVGGVVEQGWITKCAAWIMKVTGGNLKLTSVTVLWVSGVISAVVNNIPFIATLIPMVEDIAHTAGTAAALPLWWALSLGACLGGNGTLVGASANVVCASIATKNGYPVTFKEFTKYGALFTVASIIVCHIYILLRYY